MSNIELILNELSQKIWGVRKVSVRTVCYCRGCLNKNPKKIIYGGNLMTNCELMTTNGEIMVETVVDSKVDIWYKNGEK